MAAFRTGQAFEAPHETRLDMLLLLLLADLVGLLIVFNDLAGRGVDLDFVLLAVGHQDGQFG